jgi:hypothetical protein
MVLGEQTANNQWRAGVVNADGRERQAITTRQPIRILVRDV